MERLTFEKRSTLLIISTRTNEEDVLCQRAEWLLKEELEYGFELNVVEHVTLVPVSYRPGDVLKEIAIKNQAIGAVHIWRPIEELVTVAMVTIDHANEKARFSTMDIEVSQVDDTAEIVAIRAVEAIRVAMVDTIEIVSEPESPKDSVSVSIISPPPKKEPQNLRLSAIFTGEYSPGGTGFMGGPDIGVSWLPLNWLSIGFDAALLPIGSDIERGNASASFDMILGRLRVSYERSIVKRLKVAVGISVGAGYMWTSGTIESETITSTSDRSVIVYIGGASELRLVITKRVWLPLTVNVGALPPGVTIFFEDDEVAKVGLPIIECGIGVLVNLDVGQR